MQRLSCRPRLSLESLADRIVPSIGVRTIDGSGNNLAHSSWGAAGTDFIRKAPAAYQDGASAPAGASRPSARAISNAVSDQGAADIISDRQLSAMIYAWGQFIDHDMDLTASGSGSFDIPVPTGDPSFDPNSTGTQVIPLTRSGYDSNTGTTTPRQQINNITAWLDGSMIYGSDATTTASLRTFSGGRLKTSDDNLLPTDASGNFLAGDTRVDENPELTSMQTLFMREHNRLADKIHHDSPRLTDEQVYQRARAIVGGEEIQAITYKEWLPNLLGPNALPAYHGYKPNVNASIANEFATASFRFGHSLLGNDIEFLGNDGLPVADEMDLANAFFNPSVVKTNGIDPILKYLASDPSSEVDTKVVDGVRNFLFGPPGAGGLDLASLNIQRGRDHGLADYNTVRASYGLPKVHDFSQITHDAALGQKLHDLYGSVDNIDLWVGGLAEDHVPGASVGPTLKAVMTDQFVRLRDGDRFWYQRALGASDRQMVEQTTLSALIRRNTKLTTVQPNAFVFRPEVTGRVFADPNHNGRPDPGEPSLGGRLVQLVDIGTGDVIASHVTRPDGSYHFGVEDGLRTGQYAIRLAPPPNAPPPNAPPPPVVSIKASEIFKIDLPDPGPPH